MELLNRLNKIKNSLSPKRTFIGIDYGAKNLKVAYLKGKQGDLNSIRLIDWDIEKINEGFTVGEKKEYDRLAREALISIIGRNNIKCAGAVIALQNDEILTQLIEIPVMPEDEIKQSLKWELKKYIQEPIESLILDFIVLKEVVKEGNPIYEVFVIAAYKEAVERYISIFNDLKIKLEVIDFLPFSYLNILELSGLAEKSMVIISIGAASTITAIIGEERLKFSRIVNIGGDDFTRPIVKDMKLSFKEAEELKAEIGIDVMIEDPECEQPLILLEQVDRLIVQIIKSLDFYYARLKDEKIKKMILTGGSALLPSLKEYFQDMFKMEIITDFPVENMLMDKLDQRSKEFQLIRHQMFDSIGLAIRGFL